MTHYIQIKPETELPVITSLNPFRAVVVIEEEVSSEWQNKVSTWLVKSGCLYMMAWGVECSTWDDSIDLANIQEFDYEDIPEDKFVFTTWHEDEPLKEVYWFSKNNALHPKVDLKNTVIVHVSNNNKEKAFLAEYTNV